MDLRLIRLSESADGSKGIVATIVVHCGFFRGARTVQMPAFGAIATPM